MCANGEIGDDCIIYIDALVGTRELSYRLEDCDGSLEEQVWSKFQDSPAELRALCKKEKDRIKKIFSLRRKHYELITTLSADAGVDFKCVATKIQELISITDLMINAIGANLISGEKRGMNEAEIKSSEFMISKLRLGDRANIRAKPGLECLIGRLRTRSSKQAIDVIGGAILRIIDGTQNVLCHPVVSFLFLGLKPFARAELEKDLIEHFVTDDGASLLIQIDLSQYADSDSLPRLMDTLLRCTSREESGVQFPEAVRMRPCSILFLHQVEKAHISVFSALISVLDDGIFSDKRGRTADFTDTVVIITSDVGNKEIFASLVDNASENVKWDGDSEQVTKQKRLSTTLVCDEDI